MCGIAGFFDSEILRDRALDFFQNAESALLHRGPDKCQSVLIDLHKGYCEEGAFDDVQSPIAGLVHRRLSIIDVSEAGDQPMIDQSGRYMIIQNGEIYNYIELREQLTAQGYEFISQSDTEVLLYALIAWGNMALDKCIGMFSFCFIDLHAETAVLARDPFGIKPLYYFSGKTGIYFASELNLLKSHPEYKKAANISAIRDYLALGFVDHTDHSFYKDIHQLRAGHFLTIDLKKPLSYKQMRYYEKTPQRLTSKDISFAEAVATVRDLLMQSVGYHMRSDVKYGALLSGGVDSSAIIALMRQTVGAGAILNSFTYSAQDQSCDEEHYADLMINAAGTKAHKIYVGPTDFLENIDSLLATQDEPFGSTSILAQYCVFKAVGQTDIRVILDGQGADELFSGYRQYYSAAVSGLISSGKIGCAIKLIHNLAKSGRISLANVLMRSVIRLLPSFASALFQKHHSERGKNHVIDWRWFESQGYMEALDTLPSVQTNLESVLDIDFYSANLPGLLRYEDRNSMAFSIESRVPFLSQELVKFVQSLPVSYLISKDGQDKYVLREALKDIVPNQILARTDKIGFQTPESAWFAQMQPWLMDTLTSTSFKELPFIRSKVDMSMVVKALESGRPFPRQIWRWVNLSLWLNKNNIVLSG